jgi:DNA-binding transcriptional LysR family regulator
VRALGRGRAPMVSQPTLSTGIAKLEQMTGA